MFTTSMNRRAARTIAAAVSAGFTAMIAVPSHAAPVEYVKVCSLYGAGFFYIPGTDTCTSANQIVTNQFDLARAQTRASTGTAMAASLVAPWLPTGTNYAVSTHWATYDGQHAAGFSGLVRISGNFVFSGGFSLGLDKGNLTSSSNRTQTEFGTAIPAQSWSDIRGLGRAGFMYAW
ncbi:porin [Bradyrhizobium sp. 186]|uniref:porin n=1 Tax=Bradyrhizobium sp. 186 TaxID=2782654 RepID=UPI002001A8BC|nr:porin [Bradyrhizobium sp. 186]